MAVPQIIFGLGSQLSWENGAAAVSTAEAAFYATLKGGSTNANRLVNWIRETSIAHIDNLQIIFNVANTAVVAYLAKELGEKIYTQFTLTVLENNALDWALKSVPIVTGVGAVTLGVMLINRFSPPLAPPHQEGIVEMGERLSTQQKIAKVLHTSKLVLNLTLAFFEKNRLWLAISIATSGYSLLKNIEFKWLTFSRVFSTPGLRLVTQIKATYHMLALPLDKATAEEKCAICLNPQTDMAFCANHVFHQACMATVVSRNSGQFIQQGNIQKTETKHYTNNAYTGTTYSYAIRMPETNLPRCPNCRAIPLQNSCEIEVTDPLHGKFNASVTIERPTDRQYLFEYLYAAYNTAQAGLAFLQTYPEFASTIYKIQKVMLATDLIGYGLTAYYLYHKVNAKFNPKNSMVWKVAFIATLALTAVASYYAVLQLNAYLQSTIVLKKVLAQIGVTPEMLKNIDISWNSPIYHKLMQVLFINRIAASVALSFFSQRKKTSLLSIAAQLASFTGISSLKWIEMAETIQWPLEKVVADGGTLLGSLNEKGLKSLTTTYHFIVDTTNLPGTLKTITDFTKNFFNKSTWNRFWFVTYNNGVETSRRLRYNITLQNNPLKALAEYSIQGIDRSYGIVNITSI